MHALEPRQVIGEREHGASTFQGRYGRYVESATVEDHIVHEVENVIQIFSCESRCGIVLPTEDRRVHPFPRSKIGARRLREEWIRNCPDCDALLRFGDLRIRHALANAIAPSKSLLLLFRGQFLSRQTDPFVGLDVVLQHSLTAPESEAEIVLSERIALTRCAIEPLGSHPVILRDPIALSVRTGEVELGVEVVLVRCESPPANSFDRVRCDTASAAVQVTELALRERRPLPGGTLPPVPGFRVVLVDNLPRSEQKAEEDLRVDIILVGSPSDPTDRCGAVLSNADAVVIGAAEVELRLL